MLEDSKSSVKSIEDQCDAIIEEDVFEDVDQIDENCNLDASKVEKDAINALRVFCDIDDKTIEFWIEFFKMLPEKNELTAKLESLIEFRNKVSEIYFIVTNKNCVNNVGQKLVEDIVNLPEFRFKCIKNSEISQVSKILDEIRAFGMELNEKEFLQVETKVSGFLWRFEARESLTRLKEIDQDALSRKLDKPALSIEDKNSIEVVLLKCPKDLRATKQREWVYLLERYGVELKEESQIEKNIKQWCDKDFNIGQEPIELPELRKFMSESLLFIHSDKLFYQIETLKSIVNLLEGQKFENMTKVIDVMIDSQLWDTKLFEKLDAMSQTLKGVELNAGAINDNKNEQISYPETRANVSNSRKDFYAMKALLEKFNNLPEVLCEDYMTSYQEIDQEIRHIEKYVEKNQTKLEKEVVKAFDKLEGKHLKNSINYYESIYEQYYRFAIVHPEFELSLQNLTLLLKANCLLESFELGKQKLNFDLKSWESTLKEVKTLHESFSKKASPKDGSLKAMEPIIADAKEFVKKINEFKNISDEIKSLTLENIDELIEESKNYCKIDLSEHIDYLSNLKSEILEKVDLVKSNTIIEQQNLVKFKEFFMNLPMDFQNELSLIDEKIQKTQNFINEIQTLSNQDFEKKFDKIFENYQNLSVKIDFFESSVERYNQDKENVEKIEDFLKEFSDASKASDCTVTSYNIVKTHKSSWHKLQFFMDKILLVKLVALEGRILKNIHKQVIARDKKSKEVESNVEQKETKTDNENADAMDQEEAPKDIKVNTPEKKNQDIDMTLKFADLMNLT